MVDKEDLYLNIKVNHNGKSKEFRSENLPTIDELKSKIMGYLSIPDIKKYMHFSYLNKKGKNQIIEKAEDLFELSKLNQDNNEYYLELNLSIDNELNKIKQFMNSSQFNSNNNCIVDSDTNCQKLNEKEKKNESDVKSIEEIKKLKIEELQNQINEIKNRRIQKKKINEMNNKLYNYYENIMKYKKELDDLKVINFINEIQNKIFKDNILPSIEKNISDYLKNKFIKFDKFITTTEDIINKLEQNFKNNENKAIEIVMESDDERMLKMNNNLEEIYKDIDEIKSEINKINKNKEKINSNELQNNNKNNKDIINNKDNINNKDKKNNDNIKRSENINNQSDYYIQKVKLGKKLSLQIKRVSKANNIISSSINSIQKTDSNIIIEEFTNFIEGLFANNLIGISRLEKNKMKDYFIKLKNLKIEPLPIVQEYYKNYILSLKVNSVQKNELEEKLRNIENTISNLEKEFSNDNSNEEEEIENKHSFPKKEPKQYYRRNKVKK